MAFPKTVLIVDDLVAERVNMRKILEGAGINVIEAIDGKEGVATAAAKRPDFILMDVVMPGLNGFQATREIKKNADTAAIPVVMVTTKDRAPDKENAKENGAAAYLVKPVQADALLSTVQKVWEAKAVAA